jgi:predicted permease
MQNLWQDLRYGARMLLKKPGFTLIATLTLALGIGVNTAIFSVVNAVLLRPLPYAEPDRLASIWMIDPDRGIHDEGTSYLNFVDWKNQNQVFSDISISTKDKPAALTGTDAPERVETEFVAANLFSLLGAKPIIGRTFSADDVERRERVVVLSYQLWQTRFGATPDVIGRILQVNDRNLQIIGVMPPDFFYPTEETQLWEPVSSWIHWDRERARRHSDWWRVVGRLKPRVTFEQAQTEMNAIRSRLEQAYPTQRASGLGIKVVPILDQVTGNNLPLALWVLQGTVVFVLLIACANVANLILARNATREREFSIRVALGAGRARLIRQHLTESLLLALAGGGLGLLLAAWGIELLLKLAPSGIPRFDEINIDTHVLAFALLVSVMNSMIFGLAPALKSAWIDPNLALKEGGRSVATGSSRTRRTLVVVEVVLAVMLLAGAGLLIRSFIRLQSVNPGFNLEGVLLARISLLQSTSRTSTEEAAFFQQLIERIEGLPGVQAVGAIQDLFTTRRPDEMINVEGHSPTPAGRDAIPLLRERVSPGFLQTLEVPLIRGRYFSKQESRSSRVVIINETFARHFFAGEEPIGKRLQSGGHWYVIVGVVGDMRRKGLENQPVSEVFLPDVQENMDLAVRVKTDPLQFAAGVRDLARSVDKTATVHSVTTVEERLEELGVQRRFQTLLLSLFAALALGLATLGIYGVIAYSVAERTHEIGIRIALGAQTSDVRKMVIKQGMSLTLIGATLGLIAAFALTRLMEKLLYGVSPTDPLTFAAIALLLPIVALLASYIPARRATKVDPMVALKYE